MIGMALVSIFFASFAAAPVSQVTQQPSRTSEERPIVIRLDTPSQRPPTQPFLEYVSTAAELAKAVAWPLIFGILIVTQRRPLGRLFEALIELIQHSKHVKFGDMIDVEVDRSAREAEQRATPASEVAPNEIEAAARVGRMAESSDLPAIRARMLEFAHEYEATRSNMKPGPERTRAMNAIVAKMRTLGIAAMSLLREFAADKSSPGKRLAALSILELAPDLAYVNWIVERMTQEQPFLLFHASLVLLAMVRSNGARSRKDLDAALTRSLDIVQFSGGPPDRNTIDTLQLAKRELAAASAPGS